MKRNKLINIIVLILICRAFLTVCFGDDKKKIPELPRTPIELIDVLKKSSGNYTIWGFKLNYVKEKDLPRLFELLESNESCAFSVMALSSHLPSGRSTVGNEAAFLIESFWKRYYPIRLTSADKGIPSKEELKNWYKMWTNLKKLEPLQSKRKSENLTMTLTWVADETNPQKYVFVINGVVAYKTVKGLKNYIKNLPEGSTITWAPGCCRKGDEPLLSSKDEMEKFKTFCKSNGIKFILVPSG